jgi:hypothetical protein
MTKHVAIDQARLKTAVQAIEARKRSDINQIGFSQRSQISKLRRDLAARLEPVFADAGIDIEKISQIMTQHQHDVRRILQKQKAETSKEIAALRNTFQQGIENKRKALEQIAGRPYLTTPIPILTPFFIYALPAGMLTDSHTEASNNWAKIAYTDSMDTSSGTAKLSFYFAWQNPTNYLAVINCDADIVVNGTCMVDANPGFFSGGSASLDLWAELNVYLGETEINWQAGQKAQVASLSADGGNIFVGIGPVVTQTISDTNHLSCSEIEVQGDELVVFEVALVASISIDSGNVEMSFDTPNEIMCPALNVDLLTSPSITAAA